MRVAARLLNWILILMTVSAPKTLLEKIWDNHVVVDEPACPAVLYIDLHLIHEVTSPQAFQGLRDRGLPVRRPDCTVATMDHSIPTTDRTLPILDPIAAKQVEQLRINCAEFGVPLFDLGNENLGIVHVIGPELGLTQPGLTVVCGDSHTSTHGAFGALSFGIGTTEVEHVLATQCLLQEKPKTYEVCFEGALPKGVVAKDLILALIAKIGIGGGTGHVLEYTGEAIRSLSMEGRMTVCNMSIEGGARAGMIEPDDTTFEYLAGRPRAPHGEAWDAAVARWRRLPSHEGAAYDQTVSFDVSQLEPMITYGTNPGMGVRISQPVPTPESAEGPVSGDAVRKALDYMDSRAVSRWWVIRLTWYSSEVARTPVFRTCDKRRRFSRAARSTPRFGFWSCRVRKRSRSKPRRRTCRTSSERPGPSGARRVAACASR